LFQVQCCIAGRKLRGKRAIDAGQFTRIPDAINFQFTQEPILVSGHRFAHAANQVLFAWHRAFGRAQLNELPVATKLLAEDEIFY
jgi:hypothetical protein